MGLSDYDISSTLATSISQRLVRRLCPECKRERDYTEEEKRIIETISKNMESSLIYQEKHMMQ